MATSYTDQLAALYKERYTSDYWRSWAQRQMDFYDELQEVERKMDALVAEERAKHGHWEENEFGQICP